ncbi:MAG: hypothetical protein ABI600_21145 [Luteolibacter sp.]
MTEETAELEALLDLFEKHIDVPAAAVEIAHGARAPLRVVSNEGHDPPRTFHFHPRLNTPQPTGACVSRIRIGNPSVSRTVYY